VQITHGRIPNHRALRKEARDYIKTSKPQYDPTKVSPELDIIAKRLEYIEKILGLV